MKLGVQLQSKRFAHLKSYAMAMSGVQKYLSVAAAIIVIHGPGKQSICLHACRTLTAAAATTGSRQAVTKQISEAESALQLRPRCRHTA